MHEEEEYRWSKVELSVMFDDDKSALNGMEQCRLVQVPAALYARKGGAGWGRWRKGERKRAPAALSTRRMGMCIWPEE
jgi:hypothetical protein